MDIRQAQAFLAVAEELHFGRAAARPHMAQPPLSRLIRQLERDLDTELFERSTRSVELTIPGRALVAPARELVALSQRIPEVVRRARAGESGTVRLGFPGASVNHLVARLARGMRRLRPGVALDLSPSQFSHPGIARLQDSELDALIGRWDFLPSGMDSLPIAREELLVALPKAHRLATRVRISPDDLADEPWIVLPGGAGASLTHRLHVLSTRGRFHPRVVHTAADSATELLLVDAGEGIALTFSGVRDTVPSGEVVFVPVDEGLGGIEVRLAWRSERPDPAVLGLVEVARQVFGATQSPSQASTAARSASSRGGARE